MTTTAISLRTVIGFAVFALAGCAALRIDVDVYKGPLANHEDVQIRQYAALAVAARPVLASLRNRLENRNNSAFSETLGPAERDDWIRDKLRFKNETARFVNGALSFYHDAGDPELAKDAEAASQAFESFRAINQMFGYIERKDEPLAEKLQALYPKGAKESQPTPAHEWRLRFGRIHLEYLKAAKGLDAEESACKKEETENKDSTASVESYQRRVGDELQCACRLLEKALPANPAERTQILRGAADLICAKTPTANEAYLLMSRRDVVSNYSQILFGRVDQAYVERMLEISMAFTESREAMRRLWEANIRLVEKLGKTGSQEQLEAAAFALGQTIQPRSLACYLTGTNAPKIDPKLAAILQGEGSKLLSKTPVNWDSTSPNERLTTYTDASRAIETAAKLQPSEFASLLREGDRAYTAAAEAEVRNCTALSDNDRAQVKPGIARTYGFARGPTLRYDFDQVLAGVEIKLTEIAAGSAAGFERARPLLGIDSLTSLFQASMANNRNDAGNKQVIAARKRLEETLILWAERVLVAVNNRGLLPSDANENKGAADLARDAAVLQAVANTIILQADDTRRRDAHEQRLRDRAAGEASAVRRAFDLSPAQTLDELMRDVRGSIERLNRESASLKASQATGTKPLDDAKRAQTEKQNALKTASDQARPLSDAAATINGTLPSTLPAPDSDAKTDSLNLAKRVLALPALSGAAEVLKAIVEWMDEEIRLARLKPVPDAPRVQRLDRAKQYLDARQADLALVGKSVAKPSPATLLGAIRSKLVNDAVDTDGNVTKLKSELTSLDADVKRLEAKAKVDEEATNLGAVRDILIEIRGEVLKKADEGGATDARSMIALLTDMLGVKQKETGISDDRKRNLEQALKAVRATTPPLGPTFGASNPEGRPATQRDVTDDLLAMLRAQRIQALASNDQTRASALDKAIETLLGQRADLAFLRPASAYLRSVYASTSLQASPDVGWVNMLTRNTGRAFGSGVKSDYEREYLATFGEIDKQYWQNINTVNLAGGGNVNYVLAKDDIGNWYVKAYSADPGDIFKSAQGLALFGIGKGLDLNLLRRAQLQRQLDSRETPEEAKPGIRDELKTQTNKPGTAGGSALSGVVERYRSDYETRTKSEAEDLQKGIGRLGERIRSAWSGGLNGASKDSMLNGLNTYVPADSSTIPEIKAGTDALANAVAKQDGTPSDRAIGQARAQIQALDSIRRIRDRIESSIRGDNSLVQDYLDKSSNAKAALENARNNQAKAATDANASADAKAATEKEVLAKQTAADTARSDYDNAVANRSQAARLVVTTTNELIAQASKRRLDTIRQMETALTIVGQAAGGAP